MVRDFLRRVSVTPLREADEGGESYVKCGVVPFSRDGETVRFYVMKPRGHVPALGAPTFQICKGTRMYFRPEIGWRDMPAADVSGLKETLAETALREGIEELGLKLDNIAALFDLGGFSFSSATTGKEKRMWLFAAALEHDDDFLRDAEIALSTAERRWLTAEEFASLGRPDVRYILPIIERRLREHGVG